MKALMLLLLILSSNCVQAERARSMQAYQGLREQVLLELAEVKSLEVIKPKAKAPVAKMISLKSR